MTPERFEELAMRLPGVEARHILETVEFRVAGRTFVTLGWPAQQWAIARLSPEDQKMALSRGRGVHAEPTPRGERGVTLIRVGGVGEEEVAVILADAWRAAYRRGDASIVEHAVGDETLDA